MNIVHPVSDFHMKAMYLWSDGTGNFGTANRMFHFDRDNHFGLTMDSVATQAVITQGAGGNIADGTYYYLITTVGPDGAESGTDSARYRSVVVAAGGGTASTGLSWTAVVGAVSYKIYRTTTAGTYTNTLIATVTAPTTTYTDTAAAPGAGTPPTINAGFSVKLNAYGNSYFAQPLLLYDKLILTQSDGNEYIDSLADGYVDISATTATRFNMSTADTDVVTHWVGTSNTGVLTWMEDEDYFRFEDDIALNTGATVVLYNGIATEGYGVPAIINNVALTNQSASITTTNFTNAGTAGVYRVNYYLEATTLNVGATTIQLTAAFTDDAGATTVTSSALPLTALGRTSGIFYVRLASGNITYATTLIDATGLARYALYMSCERLN